MFEGNRFVFVVKSLLIHLREDDSFGSEEAKKVSSKAALGKEIPAKSSIEFKSF